MRSRQFAAFVLGFAAGLVCLCVALWATGTLRLGPTSPVREHAMNGPGLLAPTADELAARARNDAARVPISPPPFNGSTTVPPAASPSNQPNTAGSADRSMEDAERAVRRTDGPIGMPIEGIDPSQLADTFNDTRQGGRPHEALDIPAAQGTPVRAVVEGNVVKLFKSKEGGITVYQFDDSGAYCYYYAHLDHYATGLKEGMLLRKGDVLGFVGTTGDAPAKAPHLHLAVFRLGPDKKWWQGTAIDPLPLLLK